MEICTCLVVLYSNPKPGDSARLTLAFDHLVDERGSRLSGGVASGGPAAWTVFVSPAALRETSGHSQKPEKRLDKFNQWSLEGAEGKAAACLQLQECRPWQTPQWWTLP